MASSLTVTDAINFCSPYIKQQRLMVNNMQPAVGTAQIILQTVLGPPFRWRQNRANVNFGISAAGGTDYLQGVPTMGRIETQWLTDANGKELELTGAVSLPKVATSKRPTHVAPQYDDNQGNITFRFNGVPNASYTAFFDFQQKPILIDSFARNFGPVSDEFAYIFFKGFLTWAGMLVNDARFPIWERMFLSSLLGAQDGLDEQQRNIFLGNWMGMTRDLTRNAETAKVAVGARTT